MFRKKIVQALRREFVGVLKTQFLPSILPRRVAKVFDANMAWIRANSIPNGGIRVVSGSKKSYPEVTGYLIPSLLKWGEVDLAQNYFDYLVRVQDVSGGFYDPSQSSLCLFDTGQVLRGFFAFWERDNNQVAREAIEKSLTWITSLISSNGELQIPERSIWGGRVPDAISLYALEPALRCAIALNDEASTKKIKDAIAVLLQDSQGLEFKSLNHFHAYIMEAIADLGHIDVCTTIMNKVNALQRANGSYPAYPNSRWACSTGQFQYALVNYKLGNSIEGTRAFEYGCKKQNRSGGWFGTIGRAAAVKSFASRIISRYEAYFPYSEIPWANKYFMDSLTAKLICEFENQADGFSNKIPSDDGRVSALTEEVLKSRSKRILDAGCGKGRYIEHVRKVDPTIQISALDISSRVMSEIENAEKYQGFLTNTGLENDFFDLIYAIESLEHSVNISGALRELKRNLKPGGILLVIDKNSHHRGRLKIPSWEKWFTPKGLSRQMRLVGFKDVTYKKVSYEGRNDGLFIAWTGTKP
jgi:malonyl-CoA O-methyltransferase